MTTKKRAAAEARVLNMLCWRIGSNDEMLYMR